MTIQPLTGILIAVVLILTLSTMCTWHIVSKGSWHHYPAGKALMGLLAVISAITALATASSVWPEFPGRPVAYVVIYVLLIGAMTYILWTILATNRRHLEE